MGQSNHSPALHLTLPNLPIISLTSVVSLPFYIHPPIPTARVLRSMGRTSICGSTPSSTLWRCSWAAAIRPHWPSAQPSPCATGTRTRRRHHPGTAAARSHKPARAHAAAAPPPAFEIARGGGGGGCCIAAGAAESGGGGGGGARRYDEINLNVGCPSDRVQDGSAARQRARARTCH
jgi:hypothetical protein